MNYGQALKTLKMSDQGNKINASRAARRLRNLTDEAPLRYKVACRVLMTGEARA